MRALLHSDIPLAEMVKMFGPCIAPILPRGEGIQQYQAPDPVTQPDLWKRHVSKMATKLVRQCALLNDLGCDISFLQGGVLPAYRQTA